MGGDIVAQIGLGGQQELLRPKLSKKAELVIEGHQRKN